MPIVNSIELSHCSLALDDTESFRHSALGEELAGLRTNSLAYRGTNLILDHVRITYLGSEIIPVNSIQFTNCTFDLQIGSTPPSSGRGLAKQLLTADFDKGSVTLRPAA